MAAKKKTAKKGTSKAMTVPWKQALAKHAKEGKAPKEKAVSGDMISTKGGKFSLGGSIIGTEMDVVALGYSFQNTYYDSPYQEGESNAPACFAIGYDEDSLEPHKISPVPQCDSCAECDLNEWGSGSGNGKACTNRRCLALVHESQTGAPEVKLLRIAPTSIANWRKFVNDLEMRNLELMQAAVTIKFDPDSTAMVPPLLFEFKGEITNEETLDTLAATLPEVERLIEQPFDVSNYGKPSTKKKAKKTAKKKRSKFS